jgi:hypothetical protein
MTSDLDESAAAALLFELASQFRQTNQTQLAADTLNLLARRFPHAPITDQALVWLVQFYASGETAHAYRANVPVSTLAGSRAPSAQRMVDDPGTGIQPATALLENTNPSSESPSPSPSPEYRGGGLEKLAQQRFTHAVQLVEHIAQTRPLLYSEPQIRVPWALAERRRGAPDSADRYLASLAIRYPGEPWQECGAVEQWLTDRSRPQPTKPRIDCRFTTDRPTLDGELNEACWQSKWTELARRDSAIRNPNSAVIFSYDEQYLYLAIRCDKLSKQSYASDNRPRTYDADLTTHDRVRVRIDIDRDYTTFYSLTVDHRGWTNDACWGDASWNPKWFVAAGSDAEHWTAEAAIPWGELFATPPTTGTAWAVSCERILPNATESQHRRVSPRDFSVLLLK